MKKIDNLLQNEHVEWKKLGEVCEILNGYSFKSESYSFSGIRVIRISDVQNGFISNKEIKYYSSNNIKEIERYLLYEDDLVISLTGNVGRVALIDKSILPAALNQRVACIRCPNQITSKYLFHFLNQNLFEKMAIQNSSGGGQKNLSTIWLNNYEIPIPSLKTQEKIVKTLDKFTNCVTELQAELQARNKQYNYYRDKLLSEEYLIEISKNLYRLENYNEIKEFNFEDIIKIKNGKDWKTLDKGKIPVYGSGGKMNVYVNKCSYNKPTVLIPRKGSIENVFYLEEPFWNVDTIYYTEINEHEILPKYFYYFMENYDIKKLSVEATRPSVTHESLNKIKVKIPHKIVQNKIVEILDKFQSLLSDTQGLLPKEIEQRKKQYEYYREKLLTFNAICDSKQASKQAR